MGRFEFSLTKGERGGGGREKTDEREKEKEGRNEKDKLRLSQLEATPCGIQLIKTTRPLRKSDKDPF